MSKIAYKGRLQTHVAAPVITADDRSACVTPPTFPAIDFRKPTVLKGAMICFVREAHRKSMCCTFDLGYNPYMNLRLQLEINEPFTSFCCHSCSAIFSG